MKNLILAITILALPQLLFSQFAPAAGVPGSTAIPADSSVFVNWALGCTVVRGPVQIDMPELGEPTVGIEEDALGPADGLVLSLGDGGQATLTFEYPLMDGPGWDFAVFENGFAAGNGFFLELGRVEVSSDGIQFFAFEATSLTDTMNQVSSFGMLDPTKIDGLAGKYVTGYGVPFDLAALSGQSGLDVDNITHIRIIDVVGSLNPDYASRDNEGRPINDPWPTPFPSSGFDLDGVGVIHQNINTLVKQPLQEESKLHCWPNPVRVGQDIRVSELEESGTLRLWNYKSQLIWQWEVGLERTSVPTDGLSTGCYYLQYINANGEAIATPIYIF